jgi:hypothetical protein
MVHYQYIDHYQQHALRGCCRKSNIFNAPLSLQDCDGKNVQGCSCSIFPPRSMVHDQGSAAARRSQTWFTVKATASPRYLHVISTAIKDTAGAQPHHRHYTSRRGYLPRIYFVIAPMLVPPGRSACNQVRVPVSQQSVSYHVCETANRQLPRVRNSKLSGTKSARVHDKQEIQSVEARSAPKPS